MSIPKTWTFDQLGGDQKQLVLNGWQAPFGRPRLGAIVDAGVSIRRVLVSYPGNVQPTVHSFGRLGEPWELSGRWMDAAIGLKDGAKALVRTWKDFVEDEQEVRAKWGDILSYVIFIHKMELKFESEAHVAWKLSADVLIDEQGTVTLEDKPVKAPFDVAGDMRKQLAIANPYSAPAFTNILALLPGIADEIDTIVSAINSPFAAVYNVCSQLSDFTTALSSDLVKIGSGLQTVQTGLYALQDSTDYLVSSAALANAELVASTGDPSHVLFSGPDIIALTVAKATADAATTNFLALISDMQNLIDATTRGSVGSAHAAQQGDTWESIATLTGGGPDGARAIRAMNGVRFGAQPIPGTVYQIPSGQ